MLPRSELARVTDQPSLRRSSKWTPEEDAALVEAIRKHGKAWMRVAAVVASRNSVQCNQRWNRSLRPGLVHGAWTADEDAKLMDALAEQRDCTDVNWTQVAVKIEGRIPKQCKERFRLKFDPELVLKEWSADEDALLLASVDKHNGRWASIAKAVPGRRAGALKVRYRSLQRQAGRARLWTMAEDTALIAHALAPAQGESALMAKRSTRVKNERFKALCGMHPLVMRAFTCKGSLLEHEIKRLLTLGAATTNHDVLSMPVISALALSSRGRAASSLPLGSLSSSRLSSESLSVMDKAAASTDWNFGALLTSSLLKGSTLRRTANLAFCGAAESSVDSESDASSHVTKCVTASTKRLRTFDSSIFALLLSDDP